jgi:hypothetical protein
MSVCNYVLTNSVFESHVLAWFGQLVLPTSRRSMGEGWRRDGLCFDSYVSGIGSDRGCAADCPPADARHTCTVHIHCARAHTCIPMHLHFFACARHRCVGGRQDAPRRDEPARALYRYRFHMHPTSPISSLPPRHLPIAVKPWNLMASATSSTSSPRLSKVRLHPSNHYYS